jgi:hypothetical protein
MKMNLLFLISLVAITGSISAAKSKIAWEEEAPWPLSEKTKALAKKFDDCTKNHSKHECDDARVDVFNSLLNDAPGTQGCRELFPENFAHIDSMTTKGNGKKITQNIMNKAVDLKFELLKACAYLAENQNKKQ